MKGKNDGDKAIADNPYMLELAEFMELPTQCKFEVLLTMIANINQTLEAMGEDLHKLKPEAGFVYAYTPNIPIRHTQEAMRHTPRANTQNCEKCGLPPDLCMCAYTSPCFGCPIRDKCRVRRGADELATNT